MGCEGNAYNYSVRVHNCLHVCLHIMYFVGWENHKPSQITVACLQSLFIVYKPVCDCVCVCLSGLRPSTEADLYWKCNSHEARGALMLLPHANKRARTHTHGCVTT